MTGDDDTIFGSSGDIAATLTGSNDQVGAGTGSTNLSISGGNATVFGNTGVLQVNASGANVEISALTALTTVTLSGAAGSVFGGSGLLNVVATGSGDDTVGLSTGQSLVNAQGTTNLAVFGGSGLLTFIGGGGASTVFAGAAGATLFGGAGGSIAYGGAPAGSSGMVYVAGGGSETLNATNSATNDVMSGGTVAGSSVLIAGGTGADTFNAGVGNDTMIGGGGSNNFVFTKAVINGAAPSDVVGGFPASATDQVLLAGYGAGAAQQALSTATSAFNNTTLTLSDNTKITFLGTSLSQLIGHVSST